MPQPTEQGSTQLTQKELLEILHVSLETFREEVDRDILATKLLVLTSVARQDRIQQLDLTSAVAGITSSSASRHVQDWSVLDKNRKAGMDFVQQHVDPTYRRRYLLSLTEKGEEFLSSLTEAVNDTLRRKKLR